MCDNVVTSRNASVNKPLTNHIAQSYFISYPENQSVCTVIFHPCIDFDPNEEAVLHSCGELTNWKAVQNKRLQSETNRIHFENGEWRIRFIKNSHLTLHGGFCFMLKTILVYL